KQEDEAKQTEILTNALNTTRAQVQAKLKTVLTDEQMALHAKALGGVAGTTFKPAEFKPGAGFAPRRGLRVRPNASGVVRRAPKLQVRRTNQTGVEGIIGEDGAAALLTPRAELETTAMAGLSETDGRRLSRAIAFLKAGQQDAGMAAWRSFIGAAQSDGPIDIAALIQHVLRESYVETSEDLKFHAEKVQQFDEQKQAIREYLTELREIQAKFEAWARGNGLAPDDAEFTPLTVSEPVLPTGTEARGVVIFLNRRITSLAELTALIEEWDEHLQTLGDDAQLANIDLQSMLQKQQHTMRLLSQISKALHDAAMAIERKIR
ncbi:MAG TPA: hypothetical protein QGH10_02435, partial [Armatimonadota bacterium]|nr:hypothetical protein [Armatimonadota bacterium]